MGGALCKDQVDTRPGMITGALPDQLNIIGFSLNADSRALLLYC